MNTFSHVVFDCMKYLHLCVLKSRNAHNNLNKTKRDYKRIHQSGFFQGLRKIIRYLKYYSTHIILFYKFLAF